MDKEYVLESMILLALLSFVVALFAIVLTEVDAIGFMIGMIVGYVIIVTFGFRQRIKDVWSFFQDR